MTDVEVKTIENTIAKINQEIEKSKGDERGNDIYGLFGLNLDDDQKEAISTSVSFAIEQLNSFWMQRYKPPTPPFPPPTKRLTQANAD